MTNGGADSAAALARYLRHNVLGPTILLVRELEGSQWDLSGSESVAGATDRFCEKTSAALVVVSAFRRLLDSAGEERTGLGRMIESMAGGHSAETCEVRTAFLPSDVSRWPIVRDDKIIPFVTMLENLLTNATAAAKKWGEERGRERVGLRVESELDKGHGMLRLRVENPCLLPAASTREAVTRIAPTREVDPYAIPRGNLGPEHLAEILPGLPSGLELVRICVANELHGRFEGRLEPEAADSEPGSDATFIATVEVPLAALVRKEN